MEALSFFRTVFHLCNLFVNIDARVFFELSDANEMKKTSFFSTINWLSSTKIFTFFPHIYMHVHIKFHHIITPRIHA